MIVKDLSNTPFETIIECFLKSFKNYFVELPSDPNYYKERWETSKVDFRFSYGMFEQGKLVGFIIHAVDNRNEELIAFNTGTGVLPEYRGKRIVNSIYDFALPDLKQKGFTKSSLEVIKDNSTAIHLYQNVGFEIVKSYKCFNGKLNNESTHSTNLKETNFNEINWNEIPNLDLYSWDNQKETIQNGSYKYFQILTNSQPESYFVINPANGYIAHWDVLTPNQQAWNNLFAGIKEIASTIKINNVDELLKDKIDFLNSIDLTNSVDQYEMVLTI